MPKVFLVLGSSSGFGLETVKKILAEGDIAVATLRNVKVLDNLRAQYPSSQLLVLPVDVTKPDQVTDAFVKIKETFGRLDVVVNKYVPPRFFFVIIKLAKLICGSLLYYSLSALGLQILEKSKAPLTNAPAIFSVEQFFLFLFPSATTSLIKN